MCNQSVGLIQRAVEEVGIATVSIALVAHIAKQVKPPRALLVPYPFGHPLGEPNNPALQHEIIAEALAMLEDESPTPMLRKKTEQE